MGKYSEGIAAYHSCEVNRFGSCKAHPVGISPQKDRGGVTCPVGSVPSSEEGCLGGMSLGSLLRVMRQVSVFLIHTTICDHSH